ncbi:hypothetical protein DIPPA_13282 [Diplonema papillatum]|nr:hypothetical protein DIPPA_13282 [Diplonema papillatum]
MSVVVRKPSPHRLSVVNAKPRQVTTALGHAKSVLIHRKKQQAKASMSISNTNMRRTKRRLPRGDDKLVHNTLKGRVLTETYEDLSHGWQVMELDNGVSLAVTLMDPVSSQIPLQPPNNLEEIKGMTIHSVTFRKRVVHIETTVRQRLCLVAAARRMGLDDALVRTLANFVHTRFTVALTPILERTAEYPVAFEFLRLPAEMEAEQKLAGCGTIFDPAIPQFSLAAPTNMPRPITAYTQAAACSSDDDAKKCVIM